MARSIQTAITETVGAEDVRKADSPGTKMVLALAATGKRVYEGTVPKAVIARRRKTGKAQRAARKLHRGNR